MRKTALLVGNDINNVTEDYSWANLLKDLFENAGISKAESENLCKQPFPLQFEAIYLKSIEKYERMEDQLKKHIASKTRALSPNNLHSEILELGIKNIMTTNYDLSFEREFGMNDFDCQNQGIIKETLYSLSSIRQSKNMAYSRKSN